jgi:hypothetical protein
MMLSGLPLIAAAPVFSIECDGAEDATIRHRLVYFA